jgi:hypothetical protein
VVETPGSPQCLVLQAGLGLRSMIKEIKLNLSFSKLLIN